MSSHSYWDAELSGQCNMYWSASEVDGPVANYWQASFILGLVGFADHLSNRYVRCVQ